MNKASRVSAPAQHPSKASQWTLPQIYHYVLARSDSPEAAKIAIDDALRNGKLHFWGERREHKARPDLKLKPGETPPEQLPDIVADFLLPLVNFSHWDWERGYGTSRDPKSKSLFEWVSIYGNADEAMRLWPKKADKTEDVKPRERPGPPTTHDWFAICGEIARRCIDPQTRCVVIPPSENRLAEEVLGWYYDLTDRRPAESEMRKAVKEICAALRKV